MNSESLSVILLYERSRSFDISIVFVLTVINTEPLFEATGKISLRDTSVQKCHTNPLNGLEADSVFMGLSESSGLEQTVFERLGVAGRRGGFRTGPHPPWLKRKERKD